MRELLILFLALLIFLNFPLLAVFNQPKVFVFGVPLLYAYIFGCWLLGVVGLFFVAKRRKGSK